MLRQQKGFRDDIVFASPGSRDVLVLIFWETSEDADAYHNSVYMDALAVLAGIIEARPRIGTPDVLHTTLNESHAVLSGVGKDAILCSESSS